MHVMHFSKSFGIVMLNGFFILTRVEHLETTYSPFRASHKSLLILMLNSPTTLPEGSGAQNFQESKVAFLSLAVVKWSMKLGSVPAS